MRDYLLLRLDAPLVSFGGPLVDNIGPVQDWPPLSLVTGLLANALGYDHSEPERIAAIQRRVRFAVRCDRRGTRLRDFQTVYLGHPHLTDTGWTTRGRIVRRKGASGDETHIRLRDYQADSVHTLALALHPCDGRPDLDAVEAALRQPERPLFIGRKCCLPAAPLLLDRVRAESLVAALRLAPALPPARRDGAPARAWWPAEEEIELDGRVLAVTDERDWENQIICGRRYLREGLVRDGGGEEGSDAG